MAENSYQSILDFLQQYGGSQYKKQEKCNSDEERKFMLRGANAGKEARALFTKLVNTVSTKNNLLYDRITQWQNSGVFVRYFWCQMKKEAFRSSQISLSLFAESANAQARFRVSVELATEKATDSDLTAYKKLLDIPLSADLVYVSGGNNEAEFRVIDTRDNHEVSALGLKKVQVSYVLVLDSNYKDTRIEEEIIKASEELLRYYNYILSSSFGDDFVHSDWWPSEEEYTPGITKEQWIDLLNNPEIIGPVWGGALAMFYAEKEGITCAELGKKYNRNPTSISGNCTQLAKRIHKETDCHLLEKDGKRAYWPILFFGRDADRDAQGSFAWKLRPELYDALTEFGIERFLPTTTLIGTFDSWEILSADIAVKTCDKSFFEHNGSGVPRDICWFFNAEDIPSGENRIITLRYEGLDYSAKVRNDSTDRRRIQILWNAELSKRFNRYAKAEAPKAQFTRISDTVYEVSFESGGEEELTVKDTISRIKNYIEAKGFSYQDGLIENFYLSLKSKPFVILAGTSGTGKTRLVKLFAEAVGANTSNGRYKMISVRPDWSDSSDLFGHVDLNGKFIPGAIIDFVKRAELDSTHPYFLCLDEMNLARVEYYLSDFLSVIETRDFQAGHIVSDSLVSGTYYGSDAAAAGKYGTVPFPENLYVIGTVNMDETTFPFSRKVLDRANTIEFSFVDLTPPTEWASGTPTPLNLGNGFLKTEYLLLAQCADQQETVNSYCLELQKLNRILQQANAHVGYRVRDEVVFYLLNNKAAELLPENEAIDNEIMQKILPRIQGSSASIKNMLCELFRICAGDYEGQNTESDLSSKMMTVAQKPDCRYPKSAQKIAFMVRRFEEDGFTSYWL